MEIKFWIKKNSQIFNGIDTYNTSHIVYIQNKSYSFS
jgi:hypothetical protein